MDNLERSVLVDQIADLQEELRVEKERSDGKDKRIASLERQLQKSWDDQSTRTDQVAVLKAQLNAALTSSSRAGAA